MTLSNRDFGSQEDVFSRQQGSLHAGIDRITGPKVPGRVRQPSYYRAYVYDYIIDIDTTESEMRMFALRLFKRRDLAVQWVEGLLERPEFMLLKYSGEILYDL